MLSSLDALDTPQPWSLTGYELELQLEPASNVWLSATRPSQSLVFLYSSTVMVPLWHEALSMLEVPLPLPLPLPLRQLAMLSA
jgi:hypothetical protein